MISGIILDLDGTVYRGEEEVPGAADFVRDMTADGRRCLFVTNRSNRLPETICAQLAAHGIASTPEGILTASQATAAHLAPGRAYCIGEEGLTSVLEASGFEISADTPRYVIVGFDRSFNYEKLKTACRLIGNGAQFIATNPDKALKTQQGLQPGTGAIVAAVEAGCSRRPLVIGKPAPLIFHMAVERLGLPAEQVVAVGDNVETDVSAGNRAGLRTVLLLTGVSTREDAAAAVEKPSWVVDGFKELTHIIRSEDPLS